MPALIGGLQGEEGDWKNDHAHRFSLLQLQFGCVWQRSAVCRLQLQLQQWCNLYSVSIVFFIRFTTNNVAAPRPLGTCLIAHGMGVTVETRRIGWKVALIKGFNKLFKLTRVSLSVCQLCGSVVVLVSMLMDTACQQFAVSTNQKKRSKKFHTHC